MTRYTIRARTQGVHKDPPADVVCDWHILHTRDAYAKRTEDDRRKER